MSITFQIAAHTAGELDALTIEGAPTLNLTNTKARGAPCDVRGGARPDP